MKILALFNMVSSIVWILFCCYFTGKMLKDFYYYLVSKLSDKWYSYIIGMVWFYIITNIWIWSIVLFIILITNGSLLC